MRRRFPISIGLFLLPKRRVVWIRNGVSMRHAFLRMESSGHRAIPILDDEDRYAGTVTEGDLLRMLMYRTNDMSIAGTESVCIADVPLRDRVSAVGVESPIEELMERIIDQSFVPIVDRSGTFVGIVRRREVLEHTAKLLRQPMLYADEQARHA